MLINVAQHYAALRSISQHCAAFRSISGSTMTVRSITQQCSIPARFKTKEARGVQDVLFARFSC